jgi:hypothetical protein
MILRWLPWKWFVKHAARSYGVLDPATTMARIRGFAEPSEVHEPLEIVRAWMIFHARGVVNTRAIQHNLDWVWPFWVEKQFNPKDPSFIPRAYSLSHINMTHRDWTAVGIPDLPIYSLVDPRGMVTPLHDGWSLDFWVISRDGSSRLIPSRVQNAKQRMVSRHDLAVVTESEHEGLALNSHVEMLPQDHHPHLNITLEARAETRALLVVSVRPVNPEGIQFIDKIRPARGSAGWLVNDDSQVLLNRAPENYYGSTYQEGDVFHQIPGGNPLRTIKCRTGMATAAATFAIEPGEPTGVRVTVPLKGETQAVTAKRPAGKEPGRIWRDLDQHNPTLRVPDPAMEEQFYASLRALLLLSPEEIYPGPYVYKRFWYRDSCLMLNALLAMNHTDRCRRILRDIIPRRQKPDGFYESQEGEWDSNGAVLWIAERVHRHSGLEFTPEFLNSLRSAADWIIMKRQPSRMNPKYPGLLPPGFSAEHLGPNNYYFWDNFWGLAGLDAAARLFDVVGEPLTAQRFRQGAREYREVLDPVLTRACEANDGAIPAAPSRRMDAGAVGSLVADFPSQLLPPDDERITRTNDYLYDRCRVSGGFFQDMTHSGINAYLTLHMAQVYLRRGDQRYRELIRTTVKLASPTGQWPEAVHPFSGGGCMGDGQHGWAAAEFVMMTRNLFVREEAHDEDPALIIGSGLFPEWIRSGETVEFGPTPTEFGPVTVRIEGPEHQRKITVNGQWRGEHPALRVRIPEFQPVNAKGEIRDETLRAIE